jgi:hypothetical protein
VSTDLGVYFSTVKPHCQYERLNLARLPDFSVIVWIRKNDNFQTLRSELLSAAGVEPNETTEYQGMVDFHWGMTNIIDARRLAEKLQIVSKRPEVVVLRIMSFVDGVESISIKDERVTKHKDTSAMPRLDLN